MTVFWFKPPADFISLFLFASFPTVFILSLPICLSKCLKLIGIDLLTEMLDSSQILFPVSRVEENNGFFSALFPALFFFQRKKETFYKKNE